MKTLLQLCSVFRNVRSTRSISSLQKYKTQLKEDPITGQAIRDAEKVVGYPTSFLNLRWLLNDEIANIAMHMRKLIQSNHPLLNTTRNLLISQELPTWGLIVLLVSKAGGLNSSFPDLECDVKAGILHSQRVLAEVTEMIRTSNILHNSLLNYDCDSPNMSDHNFGNKIALLSGDYLLSVSFRELAGIKNQDVNLIITTSLRDLVEAEFLGPRDHQNRPIPTKPLPSQEEIDIPDQFDTAPLNISSFLGNAKAEWMVRNYLGGASLLAKCCQGTLKLAGHSEKIQENGYLLGRNMGLAYRAAIDQQIFDDNQYGSFSLISAPVMFHLKNDPSLYEEIVKNNDDLDKIDYENIRDIVKNGCGLQETKKLQEELCEKALTVLERFPESEAKKALNNMISAM